MTREELAEEAAPLMTADGFDPAFIWYIQRCGEEPIAIYDTEKCIACLTKDGMTRDEAGEYFSFNVIGAWVGGQTPGFLIRRRLK